MNKKNWSLYGSVLSVNLVALISGFAYAWTSPTLPKLNNEKTIDENPFGRTITPFEESWLTSIISLGACVGPFLGAIIVDRIGRKKTLLLLAVPMFASYLIIAFATNITLYYLSRFLLGLAVGCVFSIVPIYVGEIAEDSNRGALGCVVSIANTTGTFSCFVIGPFLTIQVFCFVLMVPIVIFVIIFGLCVPESPYYLLMVKKEDDARESLKRLRRVFVEKELEEMRKNVEISSTTQLKLKDSLRSKAIRRGLLIGSGLVFFQQCSGITVVISYMQPIFDASGAGLPPEFSPMIVGSIQLCTTLLTSQLVDRLGRRILLLSSLTGGFLSHVLLGAYFYLKTNNYDDVVSYLFWLPVCSLILFIVMFTIGLGPVTWAMVGELFPPHFRSYASTFVSFVCLISAFLLTFFFPNITQIIGMAFSFWLFAGSCAMGIVFVWRMVPETKGKSLFDIQRLLENGSIV